MKQSQLIQELKDYLDNHREFALKVEKLSKNKLSQAAPDGGWSILQCLEHLNRYGVYYLAEISDKIKQAKTEKEDLEFKPGFWGKLFSSMMLPKKGMLKMKTFADKDPDPHTLDLDVVQTFIQQHQQWEEILSSCEAVNLNKNRCSLTLPLLQMNMGSTLRFVIYHNERHVVQAGKLL